MKWKVLRAAEIVLAIVLVVSAVMVFRTRSEYAEGASVYEEAALAAELPELTAVPAESGGDADPNLALMAAINLDELWEQNTDVLGWISIPETVLSYPLLRGVDNDYYLKHSWRKDSSIVGAVFMDYRSNEDFTDFNTIIYGHRMRDGSMFASLKDYQSQEHWRTHPSIYIASFDGVYRYDIFAAYEASVTGSIYDFQERDEEGRKEFIDTCMRLSAIETDIDPTVDDHLLTLSTCTGRGYSTRWVVQAVLAEFYPGQGGASGSAG